MKQRHLFYLLFLYLILPFFCLAQPTTDPSSGGPISLNYCPPQGPNLIKNVFDWTDPMFFCHLFGYPNNPVGIQNPFHATGASLNPNIGPFSIPAYKDYLTSDGWRYITHDFGSTNTPINQPYFILYNIHSGILRIFVALTEQFGQNNAAMISIEYNENTDTKSAILENYTGSTFRNALDQFDSGTKIPMIHNFFDNSLPYWVHADFVMNYDPCTCDFPTSLWVRFRVTSESEVQLEIMGEINQDVKPVQNTGPKNNNLTIKNATDGVNKISGIVKVPDTDKYPGFTAYLPNLGNVLSVVDLFISLLNPSSPAKPTPLKFNAELDGNGTINWQGTYKTITLLNPGSDLSGTTLNNQPYYNDILGVFNLVKTPTVYIKEYQESELEVDYISSINDWVFCNEEVLYSKLETPSNIEYIINPNSGLSIVDLRASYVFIIGGKRVESDNFPIGCFKDFKPVYKEEEICTCPPSQPYNGARSNCEVISKPLQDVFIKITGRFNAGGSQDLIFSSTYAVKKEIIEIDYIPVEELPDIDCATISPPASVATVSQVCNSSEYKSLSGQNLGPESPSEFIAIDPSLYLQQSEREGLVAEAYPNPTNEGINLTFATDRGSMLKAYLLNLQGDIASELIPSAFHERGVYSSKHNVSGLPSGIYVLVVESEEEVIMKKLSIL